MYIVINRSDRKITHVVAYVYCYQTKAVLTVRTDRFGDEQYEYVGRENVRSVTSFLVVRSRVSYPAKTARNHAVARRTWPEIGIFRFPVTRRFPPFAADQTKRFPCAPRNPVAR